MLGGQLGIQTNPGITRILDGTVIANEQKKLGNWIFGLLILRNMGGNMTGVYIGDASGITTLKAYSAEGFSITVASNNITITSPTNLHYTLINVLA